MKTESTAWAAAELRRLKQISLCYWLAKRSNDAWRRNMARRHARQDIARLSQSFPQGKGNKAWKRYERIMRDPGCLVWPDYALA